ncbi:hypothetical protein [Bradyrhizobium sp. SZCCHNR2028]|uniref:HNH endonuclease n=1 Tax=Bradyrhizobium sp. SZCCHNR2028 TaxID=3057382 RepID=UPI0028E3AD2F|nr:hypothetical protein [Bradyrhizobium sp. SZCCHNR2028]
MAARLSAATQAVVNASREFDRAAQRGRIHQIKTHEVVAPDVTVEEMEKVYTQRMAKTGAPGRDIYDEIFSASPQGRCPLCTQRSVTTLDHHLPKARFPALAVAPLNLVPACSDCNKAKLVAVPTRAEEVGLHPYYDNLGDDVWLKAQVIERRPTAVKFKVVAPAAWDAVLSARVLHHFRALGLASLFASEAAEELINIRHQLTTLRAADPVNGVRRELRRRAESCAAARPNGWRTAAYRAWCECDWFCDGGFQPAG